MGLAEVLSSMALTVVSYLHMGSSCVALFHVKKKALSLQNHPLTCGDHQELTQHKKQCIIITTFSSQIQTSFLQVVHKAATIYILYSIWKIKQRQIRPVIIQVLTL